MWESSRGSSRDPVEPAGVQLDHFEGWDATTAREGSSRSAPGRDRRPTIETGSAISERRALTSSRERVATQVSEPPPAWHSSLSTPPGSHPRETSSRTGPPSTGPGAGCLGQFAEGHVAQDGRPRGGLASRCRPPRTCLLPPRLVSAAWQAARKAVHETVSLRRHCPDQVLGVAELSSASQPLGSLFHLADPAPLTRRRVRADRTESPKGTV